MQYLHIARLHVNKHIQHTNQILYLFNLYKHPQSFFLLSYFIDFSGLIFVTKVKTVINTMNVYNVCECIAYMLFYTVLYIVSCCPLNTVQLIYELFHMRSEKITHLVSSLLHESIIEHALKELTDHAGLKR